MIVCIRIYHTNHFIRFRTERYHDVAKWLERNKGVRPTTALIINGVIEQRGMLSDEQIKRRLAEIELKPHYPWTEDPLRQGGSESL